MGRAARPPWALRSARHPRVGRTDGWSPNGTPARDPGTESRLQADSPTPWVLRPSSCCSDEEGEAAPAPVAVDLDQPGCTHPPELFRHSSEHILGIPARSPDPLVELLLQFGGGALHHFEVDEHAARAESVWRPRRTVTSSTARVSDDGWRTRRRSRRTCRDRARARSSRGPRRSLVARWRNDVEHARSWDASCPGRWQRQRNAATGERRRRVTRIGSSPHEHCGRARFRRPGLSIRRREGRPERTEGHRGHRSGRPRRRGGPLHRRLHELAVHPAEHELRPPEHLEPVVRVHVAPREIDEAFADLALHCRTTEVESPVRSTTSTSVSQTASDASARTS